MGRHRRCHRRFPGPAGNGGILITDASFEDFEIVMEMNNDFGPDSGLSREAQKMARHGKR